ncbi:MAG: TSUP family transporter [Eggerthellaceae bacterium]|nr:TSUP family transporter [Eggerthellaceae bacterium]
MDPITLVIVCPLVFLAGLVDSIAGGGGLISLTAYLLAGLPAHTALGTNKLSSAVGTAVACGRMARGGFVQWRLALPAAVGALAGSAAGARLALLVPDGVFQMLMVVALPLVAVAVLRKRTFDESEDGALAAPSISPRRQLAVVVAAALLVGCYDGFYGPGTGTFMLLAFTVFAKLPVKDASGEVRVANLASNVAACVMFLAHGVVWVELGLVAAVFSVAGNYIGSGLVMKDGSRIVRPIVVVVLALLFAKVLFDLVG